MPDPQHELHRNVFTGQKFDEDGLQGAVNGSVWSIDGPATINNSSDTAFSISTKSTWSTLVVQNTDTTEDQSMNMDNTGLGIALKGHDSLGGIAHITTAAHKGRTSIISSSNTAITSTYKEALTVSPEGYIGIGQTTPTTSINSKGALDTNFKGTVTVPKVGKIVGITIVAGGTGFTAGSLVFDNTNTSGTGAAGTYTVSSAGAINSITITNAGSGYTSAPTVAGNAFGMNESLTAIVDATVTVGTFTLSCSTVDESDTIITADTSTLELGMPVSGTGISTGATITSIPSSTTFTISTISLTCTTTNTSTNVTTASTSTLVAGMSVNGTGIPAAATTISSITNSTTFVLSAAATASGTVSLTFGKSTADATVTLTFSGSGIRKGDAVSLASGTGGTLENFTVATVANTTQFTIDSLPTSALTNNSASNNKMDSDYVKIESGDGNSLLIIDKTGHIGIGRAPRCSFEVDSNDAIIIPTGTTNQAPGGSASQIGSAIAGMIRFNTTSNAFQGYDGAAWITMAESGLSDADGDTKINPEVTSDADDLVFYTAGSIRMTIDQSGAITHSGTITVGADTDGYDVKFFGDTTGKYMLWDESADKLIVSGAADITGNLNVTGDTYSDIIRRKSDNSTTTKIRFPSGNDVQIHAGHSSNSELRIQSGIVTVAGELSATTLDIGGTNITSTAAELNILDGVTSTAAELNILDGVTTTFTELNIMDGDTSATGTTLVAADRVVVNDAGTMKQVAMSDFETFMESNLDTLSSVTTVGALNSGSITSGFGSIDVGSSTITTTGTLNSTGDTIIKNGTSYNNQSNNGEIELVNLSSTGYIYFMVGGTRFRVSGSSV